MLSFRQIVLCVVATVVASANAADTKETAATADAKKQEMMHKWQEYATPGAAHKVLEPMVGEWNYTSKMWQTPKAKTEESTGTATMKWTMGGRFLEQEFKGQAMGQPFEGRGMIGYNNLEKTYETNWMDSMGTGMMFSKKGTFDARANALKDSGSMACPMSEGKMHDYRSEWKIKGKNNLLFTMWTTDLESGKEFKQMEITLKRNKEPRVVTNQ